MIYDELGAFFAWWHQTRHFMPPTSGDVVRITDNSTSNIIYRAGRFQVQQVIMTPNSMITSHRHPNVDSIVLYGSGDMTFHRNDDPVFVGINCGQDLLRIGPNDWHSGEYGPRGGVFYTVQHWLDGAPGLVIDDWVFRDKNETKKNRSL